MVLNFIAALYNEENEIEDLINHVEPYVQQLFLVDDESTDRTRLLVMTNPYLNKIMLRVRPHSGLPETVKNDALSMVPKGSWVLMLDADERFSPGVLEQIQKWIISIESTKYSHVYFQQFEIIDNIHVRTFQKSKLFRKEAIRFSTGIHEDDQFEGDGIFKPEWVVHHRKSSDKQKQREREYLDTYDKMFEEGKIDEGRLHWLRGLHHYITR